MLRKHSAALLAFLLSVSSPVSVGAVTAEFGTETLVRDDKLRSVLFQQEFEEPYIEPGTVYARTRGEVPVYSRADGTEIGILTDGDDVELIRDRSRKWYEVRSQSTGLRGWVKAGSLFIPKDENQQYKSYRRSKLERFVNGNELSSQTSHLLVCDISRQRLYVFTGTEGDWQLHSALPCSTGVNASPTLRGEFTIQDRGKWFYSDRLQSGAKFWMRYSGDYLIHSVAMDRDKKITDGILGERRSSGCIRLGVDDAQWLYENIEQGTKLMVY